MKKSTAKAKSAKAPKKETVSKPVKTSTASVDYSS